MVYLDDGLGAAADKNKAKIASLQVHADLLPNEAQCVLDPVQVEKAQSSTFRELLAVSLSMKAFVESLRA